MSGSIHTLPVTLGAITLEQRLGAGGMAEVFLATWRHHDRADVVVVKRMLPHLALQPHFRALFRREASTGLRVRDRHVVKTLDLQDSDDGMLLVVEFIDGATLRKLARAAFTEKVRIPLPALLRMCADAARGLAAIHKTTDDVGVGFVHRDISPDNLIVGVDGLTRVLDFGVARPGGELSLTRTGEVRGKLPFMAPEHVDAQDLDGRADLYALGVTMFWMLTGRRPFAHRSDVQLMQKIMYEPAPRVRTFDPLVPAALDDLVAQLLEKKASDRPANADAVASALEAMGAADAHAVGDFVASLQHVDDGKTAPVRRSKPRVIVPAADPASIPTTADPPPAPRPTLDTGSEWGQSVADGDDGSFAPVATDVRAITVATRAPPSTASRPPPQKSVVVAAIASGLAAGVLVLGVALVALRHDEPTTPTTSTNPTSTSTNPTTPTSTPTSTPTMTTSTSTSPTTTAATATTTTTTTPPAEGASGRPHSMSADGSVGDTPRPGPTSTARTRAMRVSGAPPDAVWRAGDKVLLRGNGTLTVPAGVRVVDVAVDGGRVAVPVDDSVDWAARPRGTLSVRGLSGQVEIGDARHDVPVKLRVVAGRYAVRFVDDDGSEKRYAVDVRPGPADTPTVLTVGAP